MKKSIKSEWVAALRGGDYEQGRICLRVGQEEQSDKYCCLGVLCDIIDPDAWSARYPESPNIYVHDGYSATMPSDDVLRTAHISHDQTVNLARMNDTDKLPFREIADFIEKEL